MKFTMKFQCCLIMLFVLISASGISQHLKVLEGDSVLTKVAIWEDLESYSSKDDSDFHPKCVLISGDTVLLSDFLSQQFFLPILLSRNGFFSQKKHFYLAYNTANILFPSLNLVIHINE